MKNASNETSFCCALGERDFCDRLEDDRELRLLNVLQHHALRALFLDDALVVGEVEGRGLHAAVARRRL